jgi:hypothetical protein
MPSITIINCRSSKATLFPKKNGGSNSSNEHSARCARVTRQLSTTRQFLVYSKWKHNFNNLSALYSRKPGLYFCPRGSGRPTHTYAYLSFCCVQLLGLFQVALYLQKTAHNKPFMQLIITIQTQR